MQRRAKMKRRTTETDVSLEINIDGTGKFEISTGIPFFDHMLSSMARHARFDLVVHAKGDIEVEAHHTIEDVAIVLGTGINEALGNRTDISRYGYALVPMDDSCAQVAIDAGMRSYLVFDVSFTSPLVAGMEAQLIEHFFDTLTRNAKITLHMKCYGKNNHHITEALFKAVGLSMAMAFKQTSGEVMSTKGVL